MESIDLTTMSWMEAEKAGVSRKDWCLAMSELLQNQKHEPPKRKPLALKAKPRVIPLQIYSCSRRGDVVGMAMCKSCGGKNKPLEIFECSMYGNCTVDKMPEPQEGLVVKGLCKTCKDRQGTPII